ncbi:MAG: CRTAC1 family protein [Acidithiobacillales bacterium]
MASRPRVLFSGLLAALLLAGGVWLWFNGSVARLRSRFVPEMKRLETLRDGLDELRRAVRAREGARPGLTGAEPLVDWAWHDLARLGFVEYDVLAARDLTTAVEARVTFTVGGVGGDGSRVERSVALPVRVTLPSGIGRPETALLGGGWQRDAAERSESRPRFREATAEAGLGAPRSDPDVSAVNHLIEGIWPGSGAAVLDIHGIGHEDLFVGDGRASILYENDGCGHFKDITEASGLAGLPATGALAFDYDGDGLDDLFVTDNFGPSHLFRNRGDGTFEDVTSRAGVGRSFHSRGAAAADVDGSGTLDLFVCSTGDYFGTVADPAYDARNGGPNRLFLNNGDGTFTDATERFGLAETRWSITPQFADLDGDGWPDLVVTNDFGLKNLYKNEGGKRFVDVARKAGAEDRGYGMSAAAADFSGDERLDLHFSNCYTQWGLIHDAPWVPFPLPGRLFLPVARRWMKKMCRGNTLLVSRGDGTYEDVTAAAGVGKAGWCWTAVAGDLDDDGRPDLYAAGGMWGDGRDSDRELEFWWQTLAYWDDYIAGTKTFDRKGKGIQGCERSRYFRNRGDGTFEERGWLDGLALEANGRAVVLADFDGDGAVDVYVRSVEHPEALFLGSRRPGEHFLSLTLREEGPNRAAIGARVTVELPDGRRLLQELETTSGFLSSGSKRLLYGLGPFQEVKAITVRWPDRTVERFSPPPFVDRAFALTRGTGRLAVLPSKPPPEARAPRRARGG